MNNTQQRILDSAIPIFAKHGYNSATTRAIAAAADVNETTIFRLFGGKKDLFDAAIAAKLRAIRLPIELVSQVTMAVDLREAVRALVRALVEIVQAEPELLRMLQFTSLEFGAEMEPLVWANLEDTMNVLNACLRQCSAAALTTSEARTLVMSLLSSTIAAHAMTPMFRSREHTRSESELASMAIAEICDAVVTSEMYFCRAQGSK